MMKLVNYDFYPSNLRFEPPFESLRTRRKRKTYVQPKIDTPKKYIDLTLENVLIRYSNL